MNTVTANTVTAYYEVNISSASSGFGMFQLGEKNYSPEYAYADKSDLLAAIDENFLPLDEAIEDPAFIAAGIVDVRGRIYGGDPEQIFALLYCGDIVYFGVESAQVPENYWNG